MPIYCVFKYRNDKGKIVTQEEMKHLEFIQNIITRMNANSFQIKGWNITIVSAFLAIYASTQNNYFIISCVFPVVIFWFLDAYYLSQERKYRGLYNDVSGLSEEPQKIKLFSMNTNLYIAGKYSYCCSFFSKTLVKMYFSMILFLILAFYLLEFYQK